MFCESNLIHPGYIMYFKNYVFFRGVRIFTQSSSRGVYTTHSTRYTKLSFLKQSVNYEARTKKGQMFAVKKHLLIPASKQPFYSCFYSQSFQGSFHPGTLHTKWPPGFIFPLTPLTADFQRALESFVSKDLPATWKSYPKSDIWRIIPEQQFISYFSHLVHLMQTNTWKINWRFFFPPT